jgi:NAD(P)H-flavin reductase
VSTPFGRRRAPVTARTELGAYVVLTVADAGAPAPEPGQFYMLAAAERWGGDADERPFLPRAFSVARRHADGRLDFLLEDVGPGTRRLAELAAGDELWLLGPLGLGFSPPEDGRRPLLAGGGVGIAPLAILRDTLRPEPEVLLGFRDAAHAEGAALLPGAQVATDDGSHGHHGLVTELLAAALRPISPSGPRELGPREPVSSSGPRELGPRELVSSSGPRELGPRERVSSSGPRELGPRERVSSSGPRELGPPDDVTVYACGPPAMLEAVRALCAEHDVPGQLALESGMACGFGACFGCVVPTRRGYVRLCVDGPVLAAADLAEVA